MNDFDPRLMRVGVEVNGQMRWYSELAMEAQITKSATATQNEAAVTITNINRQTRDYIMTETTPFNSNMSRKRLIVEAGRVSTGLYRLFEGDITSVEVSQPPDIAIRFKAKTSQFDKGNVISKSTAAQTRLSAIAADVAKSMGLDLSFEATDKQIANYYFVGAAAKQVEKLAELGRVNCFVDDGRLIVKDIGNALRNVSHVLSMDSGLIGVPQITEQGIKCGYFLEPNSRLGGLITLESLLNKGINGDYVIYNLWYHVTTHDMPFYVIVEAYKSARGKPEKQKGLPKVKKPASEPKLKAK